MTRQESANFDFIVVGAGIEGVCAALAAARSGIRVALIESGSSLSDASSETRPASGESAGSRRREIVGADARGMRPFGRETGILEELRLENAVRNPEHRWETWDRILEERLREEPNCDLFFNAPIAAADRDEEGRIEAIRLNGIDGEKRLAGRFFADCTRDGDLSAKAGAEILRETDGETSALVDVGAKERSDARFMGDHVLTESDLREGRFFEDEVAFGGWPLHPSEDWSDADMASHPERWLERPYGIPLRSLHSRNVPNLFLAGGNASMTAIASLSADVAGTGATMGQAIGTAAALCVKHGLSPRELGESRIRELQQALIKADASLLGHLGDDPLDLARFARAVATNKLGPDYIPSNVINGLARPTDDWPQMWASDPKIGFPTNLEIDFVERKVIDAVYLTFDTGLSRPLTLTEDPALRAKMIAGPQPETVKDYTVLAGLSTQWKPIAEVNGNYQRRRVHRFDPIRVNRLRVVVHSTNGIDHARILEVRCYREGPA